MAPELIRREPTDERIDIFSWGCTAFEFLTNKLPYDSKGDAMVQMRLRINTEPADIAVANPRLPAELCDLVRQTLTRNRNDRWPRIADMADALRNLPMADPSKRPVAPVEEGDEFNPSDDDLPALRTSQKEKAAGGGTDDESDSVDDFLALF
jgi:serine/threonine protein kinase